MVRTFFTKCALIKSSLLLLVTRFMSQLETVNITIPCDRLLPNERDERDCNRDKRVHICRMQLTTLTK